MSKRNPRPNKSKLARRIRREALFAGLPAKFSHASHHANRGVFKSRGWNHRFIIGKTGACHA